MKKFGILWKIVKLLYDPRLVEVIKWAGDAEKFDVSGQRKSSWVKNNLANQLPESKEGDLALLTELVVNGNLHKV